MHCVCWQGKANKSSGLKCQGLGAGLHFLLPTSELLSSCHNSGLEERILKTVKSQHCKTSPVASGSRLQIWHLQQRQSCSKKSEVSANLSNSDQTSTGSELLKPKGFTAKRQQKFYSKACLQHILSQLDQIHSLTDRSSEGKKRKSY